MAALQVIFALLLILIGWAATVEAYSRSLSETKWSTHILGCGGPALVLIALGWIISH